MRSENIKKVSLFSTMILLLTTSPALNGSQCRAAEVCWPPLQDAFRQYANCPTPENAGRALALLPDTPVVFSGSDAEKTALGFIFEYDQFGMLERQVLSRDPSAVRLAFRLFTIADGHFAEELSILLGTLIRIDPELFLCELKVAEPLVPRLDALLGNAGAVYVDRRNAQCLENALRIDALKRVEHPALLSVRNRCIGILSAFQHRRCE